MWCILWAFWHWMLKLFECCLDIVWHGDVGHLRIVIPLQGDAAVKCSFPVSGNFIGFVECTNEVVGLFFSHVFYAEVINN